MIKLTRDSLTKEILKYEPADTYIEYSDLDITDSVVVCRSTGKICKLQDSEQGKERLKELQSKKELDNFEKSELEFLDGTFDKKSKEEVKKIK